MSVTRTTDRIPTQSSATYDGGGSYTGTGSAVRATSPTLTTPTLGVATATSINKVTLTAPATSATVTVADGKTFTASNSITLAGTDAKTLTVSNSLTLAGTDGTTQTFQASDTIVGRATTDTLTNKTLTSPVLTTPQINGVCTTTGFTLPEHSISGDIIPSAGGVMIRHDVAAAGATAGAATGNSQSLVITSESISTAAGADYTLVLTCTKVTTATNAIVQVGLGTSTAGIPAILKVTPTSNTLTVVARNIHSADAFNGTIIFNIFIANS